MKNIALTLFLITSLLIAPFVSRAQFEIFPIEHASFVIVYNQLAIYVDPVGKIEHYQHLPAPDLILITHTHGDHLNVELLTALNAKDIPLVGNQTAVDKLAYGLALATGAKHTVKNIEIEAVPMYNTTESRLRFHPKGDGNGYVLTLGNERVYISGDTEDIPEMRALRNIDHAFVCMNLPYTMTVEQAASAVLEFKPAKVYPYHFRGQGGFSDLDKFSELVAPDPNVKVVVLDWYPQK